MRSNTQPPLRDLVREALAGRDWSTAADLAPAVLPLIPDADARRCAARMARAGRAVPKSDPERLAFGRDRLLAECPASMVQSGHAEAAGAGEGRRYRLTPKKEPPMFDRPKPKLKVIPLERLRFDPSLQTRAELFDEPTVLKYLEAHESGAKFPALEAVDDGNAVWVFAGFNRGETFRRAGVGSVEVLVYEGTYLDARFWSLSENSAHGLARSDPDARRALESLLDDPKLFRRASQAVARGRDLTRVLAAAAGVSKGLVEKVLKARGLSVEKGKLVPRLRPEPPPDPEPELPARATPEPDRPPAPSPSANGRHAPPPDPVPTPAAGLPGVPARVRDAIGRRPQHDAVLRRINELARDVAALGSGPGGLWLRKITVGGEPLIVLATRKGPTGSTFKDHACPLLLALARAFGGARPREKPCGACGGTGCRACLNEGYLPQGDEWRDDLGNQLDLFAGGEFAESA